MRHILASTATAFARYGLEPPHGSLRRGTARTLATGWLAAGLAVAICLAQAGWLAAADPLPWPSADAQPASYQPHLAVAPGAQWTPAAPHPVPAVDCVNTCPPGFEATWNALALVPDFQEFAQGEYVGRARLPHVPVYRLRVDDAMTFVFRVDRNTTPDAYRINVGDELSIESPNDATLRRTLPVLPDGTITLPLVGGVEAAGRTIAELHDELVERFKKHYNDPSILVTPTRVNTQLEELRAAIAGRSGFGSQSFPGAIATGSTAGASATPVETLNPRRGTGARGGGTTQPRRGNALTTFPFFFAPGTDLGAARAQQQVPANRPAPSPASISAQRARVGVRVTPEGTVTLPAIGTVPAQGLTIDEFKMELDGRYAMQIEGIEVVPVLRERGPRYVYVLGDVLRPGRYSLEGPTTVMQAISMAGSWTVGARIRDVVVFRRADDWRLMATKLDLKDALLGDAPCPEGEIWVSDADLIIVPRSRLLRTTNFIELVFTRGIYGVIPVTSGISYSAFRGILPITPIFGP